MSRTMSRTNASGRTKQIDDAFKQVKTQEERWTKLHDNILPAFLSLWQDLGTENVPGTKRSTKRNENYSATPEALLVMFSFLRRWSELNSNDQFWFFCNSSVITKRLGWSIAKQKRLFRILRSVDLIQTRIDKRKQVTSKRYNGPTRWVRICYDTLLTMIQQYEDSDFYSDGDSD